MAHSPERRGILTGQVQPAEHLIRLVRGPDGQIVPDIAYKLPGRGAWLELDRAALDAAIMGNKFAAAVARSFKTPVHADDLPADFSTLLDRLLIRRCLDRLGLMRKAGTLILGFEKSMQAARAGQVAALIHAQEAALDGRSKLAHACAAPVPVFRLFTGADLSAALDRDHVIHAALVRSGSVKHFLTDACRLARFRGLALASTDDGEG